MKNIGIVCDDYKVVKFRNKLLAEGFILSYDGVSGVKGTHLFKVECKDEDYPSTLKKVEKTIQKLEFDFKNSN